RQGSTVDWGPQAADFRPPHPLYSNGEWSYGDALAYTQQVCTLPILIEMESYGIGRLAQALKSEHRTVIIRVTTDALVDHAGSDQKQADLLKHFNYAVLAVIMVVVTRAWGLRS